MAKSSHRPASAPAPKKRRRKSEDGWSIQHVAIALAITIALFGWAFCAAHYSHAVDGWRASGAEIDSLSRANMTPRRGRAIFIVATVNALFAFVSNAIMRLPHAPWVVVHIVRNAIWLPAIFVVLEGLAVAFVWYDRQLNQKSAKRNRGNLPPE